LRDVAAATRLRARYQFAHQPDGDGMIKSSAAKLGTWRSGQDVEDGLAAAVNRGHHRLASLGQHHLQVAQLFSIQHAQSADLLQTKSRPPRPPPSSDENCTMSITSTPQRPEWEAKHRIQDAAQDDRLPRRQAEEKCWRSCTRPGITCP